MSLLTIIGIAIALAMDALAGLWVGSRAGNISWLRCYAEIGGAVVLYAIGLKILYEHGALMI